MMPSPATSRKKQNIVAFYWIGWLQAPSILLNLAVSRIGTTKRRKQAAREENRKKRKKVKKSQKKSQKKKKTTGKEKKTHDPTHPDAPVVCTGSSSDVSLTSRRPSFSTVREGHTEKRTWHFAKLARVVAKFKIEISLSALTLDRAPHHRNHETEFSCLTPPPIPRVSANQACPSLHGDSANWTT